MREKKGDWQKAFQHLRLIAEAYTDYDFERVAESLMRIAERLAKDKLPRKWGVVPRFRSGVQDRLRLNQIAGLARGPRFAPRALMALSEIAIKDNKEEEAIDALEKAQEKLKEFEINSFEEDQTEEETNREIDPRWNKLKEYTNRKK